MKCTDVEDLGDVYSDEEHARAERWRERCQRQARRGNKVTSAEAMSVAESTAFEFM